MMAEVAVYLVLSEPTLVHGPAADADDCHWMLPPALPVRFSTGTPLLQKSDCVAAIVPVARASRVLVVTGIALFPELTSEGVLAEALNV